MQGGGHVEIRGRDESGVAMSQGTPSNSGSLWKLGEGHGTGSPSEPPKGTKPASTLISDLRPLELQENELLLLQATQLW